jgi:hypothetical protein
MNNPLRSTVAALAFLGVAVVAAQAQTNNASIQATAVVQQPINVTGAADLTFGNVFPGLDKSIAVTDGGAGRWDVSGQATANVALTFALPASLSDGTNSLAIASYTGHWNNTAASPSGGSGFTPSAAATNAVLGAAGQLYVYVGATVSPTTTQPSGSYSGSLSMTVVYF